MPIRRRGVAFAAAGLAACGLLWAALMGCHAPAPARSERRILFADDLRVRSVRPDGTGLIEFPGKPSSSPVAMSERGRVCFASYRGPYVFLDAPKPGLYESDTRGAARRKILDATGLPAPFGLDSAGEVGYFLPAAEPALLWAAPSSGAVRTLPLPAAPIAAAIDPKGERVAVALTPALRTVVLGNQAWFTEGSDLLLAPAAGGEARAIAFPSLPDPLGAEPKLENYAGSGVSALAWQGGHRLLVSSSPGIWSLDLDDPSQTRMERPRDHGLPAADGLSVSRDGGELAFTCGGKLFLWNLGTGALKNLTPAGLVGGAHHPCWMEP